MGRIGSCFDSPDRSSDARTYERTQQTNSFSEALWREKKNFKMYKFSIALQVRLFYLWQKALWDKEQQERFIIVPLARLLAAKISSLARTHARKESWLPSQIAVQRSTKHGWAREKLFYTDPTAFQIQRQLLHFPFTSTVKIENTCISFNIPPPPAAPTAFPLKNLHCRKNL